MRNFLLIMALLAVNYSLVSAQGNIIKNGDFEEQGDWKVVQSSTTAAVSYEFGSTEHTINGGSGANLLISHTVDEEQQQIFIYQPLDLEAGKEYIFSMALNNASADSGECWWFDLFYSTEEPVDGSDIAESHIFQLDPWHYPESFYEFNGLIDTFPTVQGDRIDDTLFTVDKDTTYYIGINFGGCKVGESFDIAIDELKFIDPDIVPNSISDVTGNNSELNLFPNPATESFEISYNLRKSSDIKLSIFNSLGQEIETLTDEVKSAGDYKQSFNCSNLTSGLYYIVLLNDDFKQVKKIVISQ